MEDTQKDLEGQQNDLDQAKQNTKAVQEQKEQLTAQIADAFMDNLHPQGVMVMIEAEHLCMTMRGIKKPGAQTVTTVTRGVFDNNKELQDTFYQMVRL